MRRGWKGRRGKENKTCELALPQPQQGLGGTRRRRRFASSSSSVAGGRGREHARLPAIRILSCKPGTSTCAQQGSSGRCSKPSARRCFEWSTAGISNGRCRVMPGGAAHLTGSPGLVFLQGSNPAQSRVSEEGGHISLLVSASCPWKAAEVEADTSIPLVSVLVWELAGHTRRHPLC